MRVLVIGDIHGRYGALKEVLKKSKLVYDSDRLIVLGDICDGGRDTRKVIDELLKIKNIVLIRGNHDWQWFLNWIHTGLELPVWVHQGGYATMQSYNFSRKNVPESHYLFLESGLPYYIDSKNRIFVHGGFDPNIRIESNDIETLLWDRDLIRYACGYWCAETFSWVEGRNIEGYAKVFVGHTTTQLISQDIDDTEPGIYNNLVAMDTGAGWNGKLSIMDVDTGEYWQSKNQKPRF